MLTPEANHLDEESYVDLPEYDVRRAYTAQDPLAVIEGYKEEICLRLGILLGVRMCPDCPRCNAYPSGCQDRFGSNRHRYVWYQMVFRLRDLFSRDAYEDFEGLQNLLKKRSKETTLKTLTIELEAQIGSPKLGHVRAQNMAQEGAA